MDWQEVMALAIVALTAAGFAWRRIRPQQFPWQSHGSCRCCAAATPTPRDSMVYRVRKGQAPRIEVRCIPQLAVPRSLTVAALFERWRAHNRAARVSKRLGDQPRRQPADALSRGGTGSEACAA